MILTKNSTKTIFLIMAMSFLASCAFSPDARNLTEESAVPAAFTKGAGGTIYPDRWWESFGSSELNQLIAMGLAENFSLKEAWARLKQAKSLAVQKGSALLPEMSVSSDMSTTRSHPDNAANFTDRAYSLGLISTYELDLWGKIRSEREAALAEAQATQSDLQSAAMTIAAEIADTWFEWVAEKAQYAVLQKQLKTNLTHLELIEMRFRASLATALDVYQQKQVIAQIKSKMPLSQSRRKILEHEVALLLGKSPRTPLPLKSISFPRLSKLPRTGLPANLLIKRPDIQAAALRLKGADWQISAAQADRLPSLTLSASASYSSTHWDMLLNNWFLRLAGSLTGPVFDGKRRASEVERVKAVAEEKLNFYKKNVLTAIKEVEDALIQEDRQQSHLKSIEMEFQLARKTLREAKERYTKGQNDYLPVLTALQNMQSLELDKITKQSELMRYRVALHRALGGTWSQGWGSRGVYISPLKQSP